MGWKIEPNKVERIIEVTYESKLNFIEMVESSRLALEQARELKCTRYLVDCSTLKITASRSEIFELPSNFYKKWNVDPSSKSALIKPKDLKCKIILEFYILASRSMGWNAKMFDNRKEAKQWLSLD